MIALSIIASIVLLVFLIPLFMRKEHYAERTIVIHVPPQKAYDYLKLLKNQDEFNDYAKRGERQREFKGTDGTIGYIYAWKGDKRAGEGEKEIINLVEGKEIEAEIRFIKPMKVSSKILMKMEPLSDGKTRLLWSNSGTIP